MMDRRRPRLREKLHASIVKLVFRCPDAARSSDLAVLRTALDCAGALVEELLGITNALVEERPFRARKNLEYAL